MKKYLFLVLVLLAGLLSLSWNRNSKGKPFNMRPILTSGNADYSVSSDSDTVLTVHYADNRRDSIFIIGGAERGITLELFFCPYGDSGKVTLLWFYGSNTSILLVDTIVDTTLASLDTLHETYAMTHYQNKWGSVVLEDSIDPTAGDSVRYWVVEYDQ